MAMVFVLMGTSSLSAQWEVFYDADVLPDDASLGENAWTKRGHELAEIASGILHIKTERAPEACAFSRYPFGLSKMTIEAGIEMITSPDVGTVTMGVPVLATVSLFADS